MAGLWLTGMFAKEESRRTKTLTNEKHLQKQEEYPLMLLEWSNRKMYKISGNLITI